jgi:hypothetical protein
MKSATTSAPRFVTDAKGRQVGVLLDMKAYRRMLEAQEELEDIAAYDAARPRVMAELAKGDFMTITEFIAKRGSK